VIARRITDAEQELQAATFEYDFALEKFAVDESGRKPDRSRIADATAALDGLRRIHADNEAEINRLDEEAKRIEVAELGPGELALIAEITSAAQKRLDDYRRTMKAAKDAENEFYAGFRALRSDDFRAMRSQARTAYGNVYLAGLDAAIEMNYQPDLRNVNHGEPVLFNPHAFSISVLRGERQAALRRAV
jgi:hypothetical protein